MEKQLYELTVDPQFAGLIPPLQETELSMLTESILANGCEMPLVVWNGVIVDGHNRYRVCHENGVPFAIEEKEFESHGAAEIWIIRNQLGRRNLSDFQRCELVLPLEERLKAEMAETRKRAISASRRGESPVEIPQNSAGSQNETRNTLAKLAGVSHDTLGKAKRIIESADAETKDQLRRGELSIHRAYSALTQARPQAVEDAREEEDTPQPVPTGKPEYGSLLKKPVFDHYEPPAYMAPIPFEPVVPPDPPVPAPADGSDAAEEDEALPPAETTAVRVREMGRIFLDGLEETLKGLEQEEVDQILTIVEDIGEKAVKTVQKYLNQQEEIKHEQKIKEKPPGDTGGAEQRSDPQ